jgi:hypothetical protein
MIWIFIRRKLTRRQLQARVLGGGGGGWPRVLQLALWYRQSSIFLVPAKSYFLYFRQVSWQSEGLKFGIFHAIYEDIRSLPSPPPPLQVLLSLKTWPSLRLRPKEMAGFTDSNLFSHAGFDPNLKKDQVFLFIKRGITQFL